MALRIATWNINSVRLRMPLLLRLMQEQQPDIICLQETKVMDDLFPRDAIAAMGYPHIAIHGQKSYNGVAILSRRPFAFEGPRHWCDKEDCRHVSVTLEDGTEVNNFYIPAGGDIPDPEKNDKFAHKLRFLCEITGWFEGMKGDGKRRVLVGDLNIAPLEHDVWSHKQLLDVVSHTPVEVDLLGKLQSSLGWVDAVRHFVPETEKLYSWWSYRAKDWEASDRGRRLDHVRVTPDLVPHLAGQQVLKPVRGWEKASDHVPVLVDLA